MNIACVNPNTDKALTLLPDKALDTEGQSFPFRAGAYRFVEDDNYAGSFGFQWNNFKETQLDRDKSISTQSKERFFAVTGWDKEDLSGKNVLEVGSGAGRFSNIVLLHTQATLYSVDYSNAVEANYKNNGPHDRLKLFQASIYQLPFKKNQFDKVFCFGVLQHTPDFKKSIQCLVDMIKPGGEIIVDFYPIKGWYTKIHAKYILRPITKHIPHATLLAWIENNANRLIAAYNFFNRIGLGKIVNRFLPVCDIERTIPRTLSKETLREWVILDTFDMLSPAHDNPQRLQKVIDWFKEFGVQHVEGRLIKYGNGNEITTVRGVK